MTTSTDTYRRDKNAITAWIAGIVGTLVVAALSFAAARLTAHDTQIAVVEDKVRAQEKRLDGMDGKLDRILERLPPRTGGP